MSASLPRNVDQFSCQGTRGGKRKGRPSKSLNHDVSSAFLLGAIDYFDGLAHEDKDVLY